MEYNKLLEYCKNATKYIIDHNSIAESDCVGMYGDIYGKAVYQKLKELNIGRDLGYGELEKYEAENILKSGYFDIEINKLEQEEQAFKLEVKSKEINILYTRKAYRISVIALIVSIISIVSSMCLMII